MTKEELIAQLEKMAINAESSAFSSYQETTKNQYYDFAHGIRMALIHVKTLND